MIPEGFPPILFTMIEKISPLITNMIMADMCNMRLGTRGLNMAQIGHEVAKRNTTISELLAIPEQDDWTYEDGKSLVCSNYVAAIWKAAGLFGEHEVNAVEFTP
jgi:hypothetical protein